jgi:PEP-CTERM motif-containing protein
MLKTARSLLATATLALAAGHAGPALAVFGVNDTFLDGSFDGIAYGNGGAGAFAFVTPFLFTSDLGNTQAAATQVAGAGINYSYSFSGNGTSQLGLTYSFTNIRDPGSLFPDVTGLRFMLSVLAVGDLSAPTDVASQSWPAKAPGDPDKRQIQEASSNSLNNIIVANNGLIDGANNCAAGCLANLGLEWDLAQLAPGEAWKINVRLLDDATFVTGGRYLRADSLSIPGNLLIVGSPLLVIPEPETYALLLVGLAGLALRRRLRFLT